MNIIFRCDSSIDIGTGHVMRCLTLANALREQGAECTFVCRAHEGHLADKIKAAGHIVNLLPPVDESRRPEANTDLHAHWLCCNQQQDAEQTLGTLTGDYDWLVVDHYSLDARWEAAVRHKAKRILVIDDLANRPHDCDLLLDQNLGREETDYATLVPDGCTTLFGPKYALLRPEFAQWRDYSLKRREYPDLKQILVTMGGVDKDNVTGWVLDALAGCNLPDGFRIVVAMGVQSPWLKVVRRKADNVSYNCKVLADVSNMAQLMADSDLAIGAAGSTSWERCCVGLPTLALSLANNQKQIMSALADTSVAVVIDEPILPNIRHEVTRLLELPILLTSLSRNAVQVTDGQGTRNVVMRMAGCVVI